MSEHWSRADQPVLYASAKITGRQGTIPIGGSRARSDDYRWVLGGLSA